MQRTPFGWGADDLRRLYMAFGFNVREGARHLVVRHPEHRDLLTTVARHDELPPAYARTAVRLVEEVIRRRGMMSEGGEMQ
jgi:hypothetical protein